MSRNFKNGISIYRINGYSVFILVFSFITFVSNMLYAQSPQISINKIPQNVNYKKFGNSYYLSLEELSDILIKDSLKIKINNSIQYKNEILKFSPNSFYVVYQNDTILNVAQMAQTSVENKGLLYIPVISFFNAMNGINLINCITEGKHIEITSTLIFKIISLPYPDNYPINTKPDSKLSVQNEIPFLVEKDCLKIEKKKIIKDSIEVREKSKIINNKKEIIIPNNVKKSNLNDSTKIDNTGKDIFLYDSKKDEIYPKSYTIPKNLKKPK